MDRHKTIIRMLVGVVVFAVVATGCASTNSTSPKSSQAEALTPPSLTEQVEARLSAEALAGSCSQQCTSSNMYVHDSIFTATTLAGNEKPMPTATRGA
ncbi:MAG: hypothetical protein M3094_06055, partial [Actinomycetia bacterium]|nr:hypothetical protein [Actinomycetes bacterium]